jgi:hypothetical protein
LSSSSSSPQQLVQKAVNAARAHVQGFAERTAEVARAMGDAEAWRGVFTRGGAGGSGVGAGAARGGSWGIFGGGGGGSNVGAAPIIRMGRPGG